MIKSQALTAHARATFVLGLPLIGSHLAQMALHVTDTVMLGWYGVTELAAVVLGSSSFFVMFILGSGFAQAIMPLVAAALGSGNEVEVRRDTRMGLWLSIAFGIAIYPVFWFSDPLLRALGQSAEVSALGQDFLRIAGLGMIPALVVMALKSYLAALAKTQVVLWTTLAAVLFNAALAWAFIFGHWGAPELGVQGAALSSLATQLLSMLILLVYAAWLPALRHFRLFSRFWRADPPALSRVFRVGWPIGLTGLAESGLFQASALMMGWIGTVPLAAHGIAMEAAALAFMIHLGLSNAATVRLGWYDGAGDARGLRDGAKAALILSGAVAVAVIAGFLLFPTQILALFLDSAKPESAQIIAFGTALLAMAALFQLGDAMQVMALGFLRALRDTRVPMLLAAVSYWVIGIPASYVLAFRLGWGGVGLWAGLVFGLFAAAGSLMWRFWHMAPQATPGSNMNAGLT